MLTRQSKPYIDSTHLHIDRLENDFFLLNSQTGVMICSNTIATLILMLADGTRSIHDMITILEESYPESKDHIEHDVFLTLHQCVENHFVSIQNHE